jgi:Ca2+-binding RTX toxin-like protein
MRIQQSHLRRGIVATLAGVLAVPFLWAVTPLTAQAAVDCVVGPGVTQTDTVVTGSAGNDTIDCSGADPGKTINGNGGNDTITGTAFDDTINGGDGNDTLTGGEGNDTLTGGLGIDTISGSGGNDTLVGASNDGSQDSLDGGLGTDTCQGPAPDGDIHANCENTSTPTAPAITARELCLATGGRFTTTVNPNTYSCTFTPFSPPNRRFAEARAICVGAGGWFVSATSLAYTCILPTSP